MAQRFQPFFNLKDGRKCSLNKHFGRKFSEMDLDFFTMPIHPKGRNYVETLQEDRECALLADQLGYKEAFFGAHVTDAAETIGEFGTLLYTGMDWKEALCQQSMLTYINRR